MFEFAFRRKSGREGVNFTNIYKRIFCTKVFCAAFLCLEFRFVIFCWKKFCINVAQKLLVKLTKGEGEMFEKSRYWHHHFSLLNLSLTAACFFFPQSASVKIILEIFSYSFDFRTVGWNKCWVSPNLLSCGSHPGCRDILGCLRKVLEVPPIIEIDNFLLLKC